MTSTIQATKPRGAIRGAIRVAVSTSRDSVIAGDLFSVFVKVQNPFEVPLGVLDVSAFVPVEFYDVEQRRQTAAAAANAIVGQAGRLVRLVASFAGLRAATASDVGPGSLGVVSARSIAGEEEAGMTILRPGNSTTRAFTLCSRFERRFRPGTYRMQISVRYRFDPDRLESDLDEDNVDVIEYLLDVRASQSSILLGGIVGATLGWMAANLGSETPRETSMVLAQWLAHVLIAVGILLMFSRKKDVQPLLSVEDLYGGMLTGFLVGFSGGDAVSSMLHFPMGGAVRD